MKLTVFSLLFVVATATAASFGFGRPNSGRGVGFSSDVQPGRSGARAYNGFALGFGGRNEKNNTESAGANPINSILSFILPGRRRPSTSTTEAASSNESSSDSAGADESTGADESAGANESESTESPADESSNAESSSDSADSENSDSESNANAN